MFRFTAIPHTRRDRILADQPESSDTLRLEGRFSSPDAAIVFLRHGKSQLVDFLAGTDESQARFFTCQTDTDAGFGPLRTNGFRHASMIAGQMFWCWPLS